MGQRRATPFAATASFHPEVRAIVLDKFHAKAAKAANRCRPTGEQELYGRAVRSSSLYRPQRIRKVIVSRAIESESASRQELFVDRTYDDHDVHAQRPL